MAIRAGRAPLTLLAALLFAACGSAASSVAPPAPSAATPTSAIEPPATSATTAATPTSAAAAVDADLAAALAYVTADVGSVAFTAWARLLGSPPDPSAERAVLLELSRTHAIPTNGVVTPAGTIREQWTFGAGDLAWEANFGGSAAPYLVFQFRDTFDLASLGRLIESRGYAKGLVLDGVQPYSHPLDLSKPYISQGPQFMTNLGLDLARHRLIVAASSDALTAVVQAPAAGSTVGAPARALALAGAIGSPYAAVMSVDPGSCARFAAASSPAPSSADGAPGLSALGTTEGTALGFSDSGAAVTVALLYADASKAAADLAPRGDYAATAVGQDGQPYASTVLALANGRTSGAVLVFDGIPAGPVSRVLSAFWRRDLPFAACPAAS